MPSGTPFRSFLSQWAIQHNVSQTALDDLLIELRQNGHSDLPKASKTLLNTSRHAHPTSIDNGTYCHIGIGRCLSAYFLALSKKRYAIPESVTLDFNIDEVSGSKSSQIILWIIQMSLRDIECNPFVIGVFQGKKKPDCNTLLKEFVVEINTLISDGLNYKNLIVRIEMGYIVVQLLHKMHTKRTTLGLSLSISTYQ